jgi:tetratricopeptide (TPR) repeat protein
MMLMPAPSSQGSGARLAEADKLFAARDRTESLRQAVKIIEQVVAEDATNYEAQWRLAKFRYYLSEREQTEAGMLKMLQSAIEAGKKAVALNVSRAEGHFWLAANIGEYAALKGGIKAFGLVKTVRKEFQAALAIDPTYENGAIYLALGQIDLEMPGILGGSDRRGLERLEQGLKVGPTNSELKLALAEFYLKKGKKDEARRLLEGLLKDSDPARTPNEMQGLRDKASRLLREGDK